MLDKSEKNTLRQVSPLVTFYIFLHFSFSISRLMSSSLSLPCCLIYGKWSSTVPVVISHGETVTNIVYFGKLGHTVVD